MFNRRWLPLPRKIAIVSLCLVFLWLIFTVHGAGETFTVPPFQEVVRTVGLKEGDTVTGTITVTGGSGNDVNFYVTDPNGNTILRYDRVTHTSFSFAAIMTGTYTLHFDNSFSIISSKSVTLNYSVKTSILGIPQDIFYILLAVAIIAIGIIVATIILTKRKSKASTQ